MANMAKTTSEPKARVIDGLREKSPFRHPVVTAIEQLYSKEQIGQFIRELSMELMPKDREGSGMALRVGRDIYLKRVEGMISRAFDDYSDQIGATDATRSKWMEVIKAEKHPRTARLVGLLRGRVEAAGPSAPIYDHRAELAFQR
jgi:hypothetical protein